MQMHFNNLTANPCPPVHQAGALTSTPPRHTSGFTITISKETSGT